MSGLRFTSMSEADARDILSWRYDGPYSVYNTPESDEGALADFLRELLDTRSPYFAVREQVDAPLIGFFAYGSACEVGGEAPTPYLLRPDGSLTIGLGLRPALTGYGRGLALVEAGMAFARDHYHPAYFRLFVYDWNKRARRVYERVGFAPVGQTCVTGSDGERIFIEMTRPL